MRPLVEASVDPFWGEGRTGKGKNRLGKLLEQVREELREYVAPQTQTVEVPKEDFFSSEEEIPEETVVEGAPVAAPVPPMAPVLPVAPNPVAMASPTPVAMASPTPVAPEEAPTMASPTPEAQVEPQTGGEGDDRVILLTSDQKVLLISLRKERVIGSLQTLMKTVAVDCELNFPDNKDGTFRCMAMDSSLNNFAYHPDLQKDIQETEAKYGVDVKTGPLPAPLATAIATMAEAAPKPKPKRIVYRKKEYYYKVKVDTSGNPAGYMFFDISDPDLETPIGFVVADPKTKMPKGDIGPVPV